MTVPAAEPTAVVLARMEGKLDGIDYKVGDLLSRVSRNETDISTLQSLTQQLKSDAIAKDLTVIATAKALSEAKEAADAAERSRLAQSEHAWSPLMRTSATVVALSTIAGTITAVYLAIHG